MEESKASSLWTSDNRRYGNFAGCDGVSLSGLAAMDYPYFMHFRSDRNMKDNATEDCETQRLALL
jgi:hypothetical protein